MARIVEIEITETPAQLKQLIKAEKSRHNKERLQVIYWLKSGQVKTVTKIAQMLGRGRSTLNRWLDRYRRGGIQSLMVDYSNRGRKSIIPTQVLDKLRERLQEAGQGFSSYKEIQQWLCQEHGVKATYVTVHGIVRYKLKAKLKVARPSGIKHDAKAETEFKKNYQIICKK